MVLLSVSLTSECKKYKKKGLEHLNTPIPRQFYVFKYPLQLFLTVQFVMRESAKYLRLGVLYLYNVSELLNSKKQTLFEMFLLKI